MLRLNLARKIQNFGIVQSENSRRLSPSAEFVKYPSRIVPTWDSSQTILRIRILSGSIPNRVNLSRHTYIYVHTYRTYTALNCRSTADKRTCGPTTDWRARRARANTQFRANGICNFTRGRVRWSSTTHIRFFATINRRESEIFRNRPKSEDGDGNKKVTQGK